VPAPKTAGVYLFTENGEHRYIGRAKNLNARLGGAHAGE
jgi:excinuclease UvrABC nuclease subunit